MRPLAILATKSNKPKKKRALTDSLKPKILSKTKIRSLPAKLEKSSAAKRPPKVEFNYVLNELKKHYPDAHCALNFKNPFELVVVR